MPSDLLKPASPLAVSSRPSAWLSPGHALWQCGLRPFFLATAALVWVAMAVWAAALLGGAPLPPGAGLVGWPVWHGHALLIGAGLAATTGFVLTAVPEFTTTPGFAPHTVQRLAALWLAATLTAQASSLAAQALAGLGWAALLLALLAVAGPRLWQAAGGRHRAFVPALALVTLAVVLTQADVARGLGATRGLRLVLASYLVLVVVALARISMRIVNDAIAQAQRAGRADAERVYLSRPPKRQLVVSCVLLHAAVEWAWPGHAALPWLALAAAAAWLHLLGDWHVGRALLQRWALALYAVPLGVALAYAALGLSPWLGGPALASAARHGLLIAGFALPILLVLCIAGRAHVGLAPLSGIGFPLAVVATLGAVLARASMAFGNVLAASVALVLWLAVWSWVLRVLAPAWWRPRADGGWGCDGPADTRGC
jgi:uncharacterized protein involved in response to NO